MAGRHGGAHRRYRRRSGKRQGKRRTLAAIDGIAHHFGHAGPAFVRALVADGVHRQPDRLREQILAAGRQLAGDGAAGPRVRAATTFGVLLVAAELAQAAGVLPSGSGITDAIKWAWQQFVGASGTLALDPIEQGITKLQQWLLEQWDLTVKPIAAIGTSDPAMSWQPNSRETLAWYDDDAVYLPPTRMAVACGRTLKPEALARALDQRGLLARRKGTGRLTMQYLPGVGHGSWYALARPRFGRSDAAAVPGLAVHQGGRR